MWLPMGGVVDMSHVDAGGGDRPPLGRPDLFPYKCLKQPRSPPVEGLPY